MNEQPEALRIAEWFEGGYGGCEYEAATELRRLHALNQELLGALCWIANRCPVHLMEHPLHGIHQEMAHDAGACARAAIAKAGDQK